jgi:site-specific DNA-methyltransferase (adenine-specific)
MRQQPQQQQLLDALPIDPAAQRDDGLNPQLDQWLTPAWAAEAIVESHYSHLGRADHVLEPSCGRGAFLSAIPACVPAIGVEIDPVLAAQARELTGRSVVCGDFREVSLPTGITTIIGNPPFKADIVEAFIARARRVLPDEGEVGFVLPAYIFQTTSKVMAYAQHWAIESQLLPRNLFPRLKLPLVFARFRKTHDRRLVGFLLYRETADVQSMRSGIQHQVLQKNGRHSVWRRAVHAAFDVLPSVATLKDIYAVLGDASRRPTGNVHWAPKVRQVLQTYPEFEPVRTGQWIRTQGLDGIT